jgi:hypothetical protein
VVDGDEVAVADHEITDGDGSTHRPPRYG